MARYVALPILAFILGIAAAITLGYPPKICLLGGLLGIIGYVAGRVSTLYMVLQGGTSGPSWLERWGGWLFHVLPAVLALGCWSLILW